MKRYLRISLLLFSLPVFLSSYCFAQSFENAVQYMDHIGKANQALTEKYLVYLSGMSHGKSARKVEKRRLEVVQAISNTARKDPMRMLESARGSVLNRNALIQLLALTIFEK